MAHTMTRQGDPPWNHPTGAFIGQQRASPARSFQHGSHPHPSEHHVLFCQRIHSMQHSCHIGPATAHRSDQSDTYENDQMLIARSHDPRSLRISGRHMVPYRTYTAGTYRRRCRIFLHYVRDNLRLPTPAIPYGRIDRYEYNPGFCLAGTMICYPMIR